LCAGVTGRQVAFLAGCIDHTDQAGVVGRKRMGDEGEQIGPGRETRMTDAAGAFVDRLSDGPLDATAPGDVPHYQERAVREPLGFLDVLEDLARCAARERDASQRSACLPPLEKVAVQRNCQLAA